MKALVVAVNQEKFPYPVMPIGAACICASLEQNGHEVEFLDLMFSPDVDTSLRQAIQGFLPQAILRSIPMPTESGLDDHELYRSIYHQESV